MTATIGHLTVEEAAKEAAGNWREFDCFHWYRKSELESPEDWGIFYTHHRDSTLVDRSNADVIAEAMEPFIAGDDPDVVFESHNHWAVGWVSGISLRVIKNGRITKAFRTYHELSSRLADYPILDDYDYCEKEKAATLENITDAAWRLKNEYDLPDNWEEQVYRWFWDEDDSLEIENTDDSGGYPTEEGLRKAFDGLRYQKVE